MDNQKKNLLSSNTSSTCRHNMVNVGPLGAEIASLVWGTPANFAFRFRYCSDVAAKQTLHDVWPSPGIHFRGFLPRNGILPGATLTLRASLALSYFGRVTARHSTSGRQPNCVLSRGRHLYSAGRPSRWALAHILVITEVTRVVTFDISRPLL